MARMTGWTNIFSGYRVAASEPRIERWLDQFDENDRDLAARILDSVEFISHDQMSAAFRAVLNGLPGWHSNPSQRRGKWRFVAFTTSAGESGDSMLHKFRIANGLGAKAHGEMFIHMRDLLRADLGNEDTVVFVDDFAGTGDQACSAWEESISELLPGDPNIYLVLVAASLSARRRISEETSLQVVPYIEYGETDNIFSDACIHFTADEKETAITYCQRADRRHPKGYGECGLVVVFAHNCPNNSIPILHANHEEWEGLFRRFD